MPPKPRSWPKVAHIALTLTGDVREFVHKERKAHGETAQAWVLALLRREMLRKKVLGK